MVKEIVKQSNLWNKLSIEDVEDRKEFHTCIFYFHCGHLGEKLPPIMK